MPSHTTGFPAPPIEIEAAIEIAALAAVWEPVLDDAKGRLERITVAGGWIYRPFILTHPTFARPLIYIPDPVIFGKHANMIKPLPVPLAWELITAEGTSGTIPQAVIIRVPVPGGYIYMQFVRYLTSLIAQLTYVPDPDVYA